MSEDIDEKPVLFKRMWLSRPTRKGRYARHLTRVVDNFNVTTDEMLSPPESPAGWSHVPYELYHHASTVAELKKQIADIKAAWIEHHHTKFKSDGSHFQADIKLNQLLGVTHEPNQEQQAPSITQTDGQRGAPNT